MRRALILTVLFVAGAAAPAVAQQAAPGSGLRYLAWPGKPPETATAAPAPAGLRPARIIPRSVAPAAQPTASAPMTAVAAPTARRGLTPADAWLRPGAAPAPSQPPAYAPGQPGLPMTAEAAYAAPAPAANPAPTPASTSTPFPQPAPVDPRAPRRDAPIFRLQRPEGQAAAPQPIPQPHAQSTSAAQPPSARPLGSRYYSVHRQAGRQPDAMPNPQPVYLDALPVELATAPGSGEQDLAQPPAAPTVLRGADGRIRPAPATDGDTLP